MPNLSAIESLIITLTITKPPNNVIFSTHHPRMEVHATLNKASVHIAGNPKGFIFHFLRGQWPDAGRDCKHSKYPEKFVLGSQKINY